MLLQSSTIKFMALQTVSCSKIIGGRMKGTEFCLSLMDFGVSDWKACEKTVMLE
jgi:hypothetical protein